MRKNVKFYKCNVCKNVIGLIEGDPANIKCCNKPMQHLQPISENNNKNNLVCKKEEDKLIVNVGKFDYPMSTDDYIMWIAQVTDNQTTRIRLHPGELPQVIFPYVGNSIIYAYSNKGNLLETEFES